MIAAAVAKVYESGLSVCDFFARLGLWAQAHAPDCSTERCMACAGKLGDDANKGKAQVAPLLCYALHPGVLPWSMRSAS